MNEFLPPLYLERVDRLALGLEPQDAVRFLSLARPIEAVHDGLPLSETSDASDLFGLSKATSGLKPLSRRSGGRFAILQAPGVTSPVDVRLADATRRYVPRRLRCLIPMSPTSTLSRIRRPALFPGAAYDVSPTVTGLRGRVTWTPPSDAPPVRWCRVEASVGGVIVGRAHGDDRGEFLLMLHPSANGGPGDLRNPFTVIVSVFGPASQPLAPPQQDPLWDLPLETLPLTGTDNVSPGIQRPASYTAVVQRSVTFTVGRLRSDESKFVLIP
jgi:hypothetical protein